MLLTKELIAAIRERLSKWDYHASTRTDVLLLLAEVDRLQSSDSAWEQAVKDIENYDCVLLDNHTASICNRIIARHGELMKQEPGNDLSAAGYRAST